MINFYDKLSKEDKSETKLDKYFRCNIKFMGGLS